MKKIVKLISIFFISIMLTGCLKVNYQIKIIDRENAEVSMKILYPKTLLDSYNMKQEDINAQLQNENNFEDWKFSNINEKIDGEEYIGFKAVASKNMTKELLKNLSVKDNSYTLKIENSNLQDGMNICEDDSCYTIEQLKKADLDINLKIVMPGKIKSSSVGNIMGDTVNIGLSDFGNVKDGITIVSQVSNSSDNKVIIARAIIGVIIVMGYIYLQRRRK